MELITSASQKALDNSPWKEYEDPSSGRKYYHNIDTKETVWDMPKEYKVLLDRLSTEIKASLNVNSGTQASLTAPQILEFRTKEDAEDCFREMLEDFNVDATWY
ncbi:hypothetical protein HDV03_002056 [Kappamyces sp. JEL0829]|nr:hypothetical protein HDV03_002056 [Kappamyces sp. JEL0829]